MGTSYDKPTEARGGTIHCASGECERLRNMLEKDGQTLIHADSGQSAAFREALDVSCTREGGLSAWIVVECNDRKGMILDVATVVTAVATNIINVQSKIYKRSGRSALKYEVSVQNRPQLEELIAAVAQVTDVTRVVRSRHYPSERETRGETPDREFRER